MIFEYQSGVGFDCIKEFAKRFKSSHSCNILDVPVSLGKGFIKMIDIADGFRIVFHLSKMKDVLLIKKQALDHSGEQLVFRFIYFTTSDKNYLSSVQVMNMVDINDSISPNTGVCYCIISIRRDILLNLLDLEEQMQELQAFISNFTKPFLYQEIITPEMKSILRELSEHREHDKLERLYYKTKVTELIYEFFSHFLRRNTYNFVSVNKADIEKIVNIEKMVLSDLGKVPVLTQLSQTVGMSETKMKRLFKKIFGDSIYNYYSKARMIEAASLLKNNNAVSVSEVGYGLGFSNLSHFSKMFHKHIGMKPKEYAMKHSGLIGRHIVEKQ